METRQRSVREIFSKGTDSLRQFLEYLIAQVDENITLYRRIYQTNKNGSLMFTIQGDLAKILTESGWQGENQGVRLKIPLPLYVTVWDERAKMK